MKLTPKHLRLLTIADAQYIGAVCSILAESHPEAHDYYAVFHQYASPAECKPKDALTQADVRDILLCTARTAVRLLEGR